MFGQGKSGHPFVQRTALERNGHSKAIVFFALQSNQDRIFGSFLELNGQTLVIYNFSYFPNGQTSVLHQSILFFIPPILQTSDFGR